jgi:TetR/AcrR family transcriptional regulator, regulator of autoinduction and epiphytic fitness
LHFECNFFTIKGVDGRAARGARNRQAVIDAALALIAEDTGQPTAQAIAARAGVSTRSVFHHFDDLDSLFADAAHTQAERHWGVLEPPPDTLERALAQRAELFERIGATRRFAARHEHQSPVLAERMRESRAALRTHIRKAIGPDIHDLGRATVAAVEAAASWETWEVLRRHQGLSVPAATAAVRTLIEHTLEYTTNALR